MTIHSDTFDFWRNEGVKHIIPEGMGAFPEGWDPRPFIVLLSAEQQTVEFGCGYGRLAGLFDPEKYLGIDLNPNVLAQAKDYDKTHRFELLDYDKPLPDAPFYFAYTVFLHIDDDTLVDVMKKAIPASCERFLIAEVMGREWRNEKQTHPPVFNRDPQEYVDIMKASGFDLTAHFEFPYIHYAAKLIKHDAYGQMNTNINFLLFHRTPAA